MKKGCPEYCEKNPEDPLCGVDPKDPCKKNPKSVGCVDYCE